MKHLIYIILIFAASFTAKATSVHSLPADTFTSISIQGSCNVYISQGAECKVTFDKKDHINTSISPSGELTIQGDGNSYNKVYVTVINLKKLILSGACIISVENTMKLDNLVTEVSGASKAILRVEAKKVTCEATGASKVVFIGSADELQIEASGASKVNADMMPVKICKVEASGSSKCVLDVTESLEANASGASGIYYKSMPANIKELQTGNGRIAMRNGNSSSDTSRFNIGGKRIIVLDDDDKMFNDTAIYFPEEPTKAGFNWRGIDLCYNGLLNGSNQLTYPSGYSFMEQNHARSIGWNLNLLERHLKLYKNYVMVMTGLGFSFNNYNLIRNPILKTNSASLSADEDTVAKFKRNKLKINYLTIPVLVGFNTNKYKSRSFHISAGIIYNLKLVSKQRLIYTTDNVEQDKVIRNDFNTDYYKLDATVRLRYKGINLFATYGLNSLFKQDEGPVVHPVAIGFSIVGF